MEHDAILAVDLDGTLVRTDLMLEAWWSLVARDVPGALRALARLPRGRAAFKAALADRASVDVAGLPYRQSVLRMIRDRRAGGGRVALVTASDARMAEAVAAHLGCIDEVYGSNAGENLKGEAKAAFLAGRFGARGFDYVGDATADIAVWRRARRAITVDAPPALRRAAAEAAAEGAEHLDDGPATGAPPWLTAIRPHQWVKNLLVFLPVAAAHSVAPGDWAAAALAFICFSLVASGVYLLNDLLDLAADRAHARTRLRPLASGALPLAAGSVLAPALAALGLLLALLFAPPAFAGALAGYLALTTAYSLYLKRRLVIDICVLAGLYTIRVFAGAAAAGLTLSPWLLVFSIFLFLSLAAVKRQAELVQDLADGREKVAGRAYVTSDLPVVAGMALASGYVAALVVALYVNAPGVAELYAQPLLLWGFCPILVYWISRTVMVAHRGGMQGDPVVYALRDRVSQLCALAALALAAASVAL